MTLKLPELVVALERAQHSLFGRSLTQLCVPVAWVLRRLRSRRGTAARGEGESDRNRQGTEACHAGHGDPCLTSPPRTRVPGCRVVPEPEAFVSIVLVHRGALSLVR